LITSGIRMRSDRLITLKLVQPFRQATSSFRGVASRCLPVLMYHSVADQPEPGVRGYYQTTTRPDAFARQMARLKAEGFQGVDLSAGLTWLHSGSEIGNTKLVAITFDDGFRNFHTSAAPVLMQAGFTATMFLPTAFIGQTRRCFKTVECLTWPEVRELRRAGMQFGSHTVNHPRLVELAGPQIEAELRDSKTEMENQLGEPVTTFAYPYAFPQSDRRFCEAFRQLLATAGYDCCVTTEIGRVRSGDDVYGLKRLPVNSLDDDALLLAKLDGSYDWLARPQKLIKQLKRQLTRPRSETGASHPIARSQGPVPVTRTTDC
jgi:peptidoglycan/xylan/chitin deacetylase (PgdA/CDA1 family)